MSVSLLNKHNRLALAYPLSNLSPVYQNVHKKENWSVHLATRETASYILFSAKTQVYKQNKYTYTQSGGKKSLFQILSDYYRTVFSVLSRGNEKLLKSCGFTRS